MLQKLKNLFCFCTIAIGAFVFAPNVFAIDKTNLTLDLNFGNNDRAAAPIVYDTSGYYHKATSTAGATSPKCNTTSCVFDGGDSMTAVGTNIFNSVNISIAVKFMPTVAISATSNYLFASASFDYRIVSANGLFISLGNTNLTTIPLATYSPYWNINRENIILVTGTSGSTKVYLNGILLTTDAAAWTNNNPTNLVIGKLDSGGGNWNGRIYYMKVWNRQLTDAEIGNIFRNTATFTKSAPRAQLVGYWPMNVGDINGSALYDRSGKNLSGTISGTTNVRGQIKEAKNFNGTTDTITIASSTPLGFGLNPFTLSAWIKPNSTGSLNRIFSRSGFAFEFGYGNGDSALYWYDGTWRSSGVSINLNEWTHVAITRSGSSYTIYKNGIGTTVAGGNPNVWGIFYIGGAAGSSAFPGAIDDARAYNYALSAIDIAQLYSAAKTVYTNVADRTGLVGWWTMDRTDKIVNGTIMQDRSPFNNRGTLSGTLTEASGVVNQSLDFNGTNSYISIPDKSSLKPTTVTVAAWVKLDGLNTVTTCGNPGVAHQYAVFKRNSRTDRFEGYGLLKNSGNGMWNFAVSSSAGVQGGASATGVAFVVGKWVHLVGTFSQPNSKIYVDGVLAGQSSSDNFALNYSTRPVFIGRSGECNGAGEGNWDAYFNGKIDDVRIYNRALSAQEVSNLYNSAKVSYIK
jgi:hypothetical protein